MSEEKAVRNLSPAPQRSYLHAVTKFGRFVGRSLQRLGLAETRTFQVHLAAIGISLLAQAPSCASAPGALGASAR
jgi:hypothetical protein